MAWDNAVETKNIVTFLSRIYIDRATSEVRITYAKGTPTGATNELGHPTYNILSERTVGFTPIGLIQAGYISPEKLTEIDGDFEKMAEAIFKAEVKSV